MPITYRIDPQLDIITMTLIGRVTADEFLRYFRETREDPSYDPRMHRLILLDRVDAFPTSADLSAVAGEMRMRLYENPARIAVVVDTALQIGVANMIFGQAGLHGRFKTFFESTSAVAWLLTARTTAVASRQDW
jgi:hypothetical protein